MMQSDFVVGLFYGPMRIRRGKTDMSAVDDNIRTKQVYTSFLVSVHFLLCILALFISLVPGACLGGGPGGVTFSALPRTIWQVPTLIVLYFTFGSLYFDSNTNVASTVAWLMTFMWFMSILVVINLVSLISLILEVNNVGSTLWLENSGAWVITLLVGNVIYILVQGGLVHRLWTLRTDLVAAFAFGWRPGKVMSEASGASPEEQLLDSDADAYTAPPTTPASSNETPASSNETTPVPTAPPAPSGMQSRIASGFRVGTITSSVQPAQKKNV